MRPTVKGKFIFTGDEKYYLRGTTYGPFKPDESGSEYHCPELVKRDFAQMAASGINTVRTYTNPPIWLLDIAQEHGLRVMIGLPWEQHIAFLDDAERVQAIVNRVCENVRAYAGHPGLFCYAIGNEIPAPIVRWHGRRRIERFLKRLYHAAKSADPGGLVTYVNYPTTEYLKLDFLDFACFNVYLEEQAYLEAYIGRLHNVVGEIPLVLAEIGLDSLRNGAEAQAETLDWQLRTSFAQGCAGAFVFAWTDEWYRGGNEILDWDFGLTDRERKAKPALSAVSEAFAETPFPADSSWPRISVVVASHNGACTIGGCLDGLAKLDYPDYEVIVVNDGSDDGTGEIADKSCARVIHTANQGLSSARNSGIEAATGEIVAFIDDDAYPDPHWLTYLAHTFATTSFAGVGGPNITPEEDSLLAKCVGEAPGNPTHVLLSDTVAEHIPGVNMSFRKSCLQEIEGFDPQFRAAGDDVDICWQMQERGWQLGYNPAALVWHHRRPSLRTYLKQQSGYGKAEALLEKKWPEKYNSFGHVSWNGRVYVNGAIDWLPWRRGRVYQGTWGTALFQSIYQPAHSGLSAMFLMPEWHVVIWGLGFLTLLGVIWRPLVFALPLFVLASAPILIMAGVYAGESRFVKAGSSRAERVKRWLIISPAFVLQPFARLIGRIRYGLTFFRRSSWENREGSTISTIIPKTRTTSIWSEKWRSSIDWLQMIEQRLKENYVVVWRSGDFDRWDMELRTGQLSYARVLTSIEEHGDGEQMIRLRIKPKFSKTLRILMLFLLLFAVGAGVDGAWVVAAVLAVGALWAGLRMLADNGRTTAVFMHVIREINLEQIEIIKIVRIEKAKKKAAKEAAGRKKLGGENIEIVYGEGLVREI